MKTIHHVVDIDTSPQELFEAITTQDGLAGWWTTQVSAPSAAVGSVVDFTFGGDFNPDMEITELEDGRRLTWRCVGGHEPWADNTFQFAFEARDGGTRLRFWQHYATELDDDEFGIYNYNWGYYLQSLYELVTTGRGKPFDPSTG